MRIVIAYAGEQPAQAVVAEVHRRAPNWEVTHCTAISVLEMLLTEQEYDLIVADLDLFKGTSLEDLAPIKALAPDAYWIVVASPGDQLLGARALSAGADYHLTKHDRWPSELLLVAKYAEGVISQRRQVRRTAELARRLVDLGTTIATDNDLPDVLAVIGETAISITDAVCCWLGILDEEGSEFAEHYTYGDTKTAAAWRSQILDAAWTTAHYNDLLVSQLEGPHGGPGRIVSVPITAGGLQASGTVVLITPRLEPLSELHRNALQFLAAHAAIILQTERLHQLVEQRTRQMEAAATQAGEEGARARTLLSAAVAVTNTRKASEVLEKIATNAAVEIGFDRVSIYLADSDHEVLQGALQAGADGTVVDISDRSFPLKSDDNVLAHAALGDAPFVTCSAAEMDQDPDSQGEDNQRLLVPLRTQGNLVGIMSADNRDSGAPISAQQIRLLRSLAAMAAVALERIRVDKLRELFVSSISHELRAPLASMQATNELVLEEEVGQLNQQQREYLSRIDSSCQHMRRILDDLTDWSHLQAGKISVRKQPVDVRESVRRAAETLYPRADHAGVELRLSLPAEHLELFTDPQRLEQVIINLVDNAIKFNYTGGQVEVSASVQAEEMIIKVADTGPGISAGLHDRIFEAFNRGSDEISRAVEGVGLGLAIAAQITKLLGGRLSLESQLGEGSTFAIHLPFTGST